MNKNILIRNCIIGIFVLLYMATSLVSMIHTIDFFLLTNPKWLAISLAVAFEVGAMASLAAIIILDKTSRTLVWFLFILLTLIQMMGNTSYAYDHANNFQSWMELFGLNEEEPIYQKRILAIISGAILPVIALGFIKSLVDYIRPDDKEKNNIVENKGSIALDIIPNIPLSQPNPETIILEQESEITNKEEIKNTEPIIEENKIEELDEDALFKEEVITHTDKLDKIESTKNETISDTIDKIEEITNNNDLVLDKPHDDAKIQIIKDVRKEELPSNLEASNIWPGQKQKYVSEEPGTGGQRTRTFGPSNINNII